MRRCDNNNFLIILFAGIRGVDGATPPAPSKGGWNWAAVITDKYAGYHFSERLHSYVKGQVHQNYTFYGKRSISGNGGDGGSAGLGARGGQINVLGVQHTANFSSHNQTGDMRSPTHNAWLPGKSILLI